MLLKNKNVIFITGDSKKETAYFVDFVFKNNFSVFYTNKVPDIFDFFSIIRSNIIIIEDDTKEDYQKIKKLLQSLSFCTFVVTETKNKARVKKILKGLLEDLNLVLDFSIAKKLEKRRKKTILTFGINKKSADFYVSDIHQKEDETNFKVNYEGATIPFWFQEKLKNREIYAVLPALCIAKLLRLNLAEVSYKIKEAKGYYLYS